MTFSVVNNAASYITINCLISIHLFKCTGVDTARRIIQYNIMELSDDMNMKMLF